jgi:hypothetical protein
VTVEEAHRRLAEFIKIGRGRDDFVILEDPQSKSGIYHLLDIEDMGVDDGVIFVTP